MLCYSVFAVILMACLFNSGDAQEAANNAPTFAETSYAVCVEDGKAVGETVATFSATDADTDDTLTYSISSGNDDDAFKVTADKLDVKTKLDMSTKDLYNLAIEVEDVAKDTASTTYVISVKSSCSGASALAASLTALLIGLVYILN